MTTPVEKEIIQEAETAVDAAETAPMSEAPTEPVGTESIGEAAETAPGVPAAPTPRGGPRPPPPPRAPPAAPPGPPPPPPPPRGGGGGGPGARATAAQGPAATARGRCGRHDRCGLDLFTDAFGPDRLRRSF